MWLRQDSEGRTALHFACDRGQAQAVELLLANGASLQKQDSDGQSPLHLAVICEHADVIALLVRDLQLIIVQPDEALHPSIGS